MVFERVLAEATRLGVEVVESEIIRLVPEKALPVNPADTLRIRGFSPAQILEERVREAFA